MTPDMESRSLGTGRIRVPVVGLGTWRRLEAAAAAGKDRALLDAAVAAGVRLIDPSPMYGDAEELLGTLLQRHRRDVLVADKVWSSSETDGAAQLARATRWYR